MLGLWNPLHIGLFEMKMEDKGSGGFIFEMRDVFFVGWGFFCLGRKRHKRARVQTTLFNNELEGLFRG